MAHWDPRVAESYNRKQHEPPDDIGSNFYPELGPYSSRNITVIYQHMRWIRDAGIGKNPDIMMLTYCQSSDNITRFL